MNTLGHDEMLGATVGHLRKEANHAGERFIERIAAEGCPVAKPMLLFLQVKPSRVSARPETSAPRYRVDLCCDLPPESLVGAIQGCQISSGEYRRTVSSRLP